MVVRGHVRNGVAVPDDPAALPEGAVVQIEVVAATPPPRQPRQGGQYAGQVHMAPDFDEWTPDIRESLGMEP